MKQYAPNNGEPSIETLNFGGGGGGGGGGSRGRCEWRSEVFVKIQKIFFEGAGEGGGGGGGSGREGGQGRCVRRSEVFENKKNGVGGLGSGWGWGLGRRCKRRSFCEN